MNRKTDNDNELLDDVLAEAAPDNFREAMLGETLRVVRRRRRYRQIRNGMGIIVALALMLAGLFVWQRNNLAERPTATPAGEKHYTLVRTQPLPSDKIVETVTASPSAVQIVSSTSAVKIVEIETTADNFRVIDDQELLALVASHPAILVRTGPQSEELVFANPKDANGFPVN